MTLHLLTIINQKNVNKHTWLVVDAMASSSTRICRLCRSLTRAQNSKLSVERLARLSSLKGLTWQDHARGDRWTPLSLKLWTHSPWELWEKTLLAQHYSWGPNQSFLVANPSRREELGKHMLLPGASGGARQTHSFSHTQLELTFLHKDPSLSSA